MPRQLVFLRVPVDLSILEFDLTDEEELFLTYTWGREQGPHIERDGRTPPYMLVIGDPSQEPTSDAFALRLGTWLIQEQMRQDERAEAEQALRQAMREQDQKRILVLKHTLEELDCVEPDSPKYVRAHDAVFLERLNAYKIIGQQGCGDLTMNYWNVAYLNSPLANQPPALIHLPDEELEVRTYSCLVKWKADGRSQHRMTIQEVKFRRRDLVYETNQIVEIRYDGRWLPRGDSIEFALSNQQVIRAGKIVPVVTTCHQFSDVRHLLQLPNLNPKKPLYIGEAERERRYFGNPPAGDVWFGERAFIEDASRNLLRAALSSPIKLEFSNVADERRLRGALQLASYHETLDALEPLAPGHWRFIPQKGLAKLVEIYFKRNTYGWTMIGLTQDNTRLLCLAAKGVPGQTGYTLEEAAKILLQAGAWNALLIDEGLDVFQFMRKEDGQLHPIIEPRRRRLRATFTMGVPK